MLTENQKISPSQKPRKRKGLRARFVVIGNLVSMKNSREIFQVKRKGQKKKRPLVAKSEAARRYAKDFAWQVTWPHDPITDPLKIIVFVWYRNWQSDLDCELIPDLLQKVGVIKNDRQFKHKQYLRMPDDKKNPRVIILLEDFTYAEPRYNP